MFSDSDFFQVNISFHTFTAAKHVLVLAKEGKETSVKTVDI